MRELLRMSRRLLFIVQVWAVCSQVRAFFFFNVGAWLWRGFVEVDVLTCLLCTMLGYRHLPLHDQQLSQYLFSTLFVNTRIRDKTST